MKRLLGLCFAASFVGAQCSSVAPLTRTCSGSSVQTAYFTVGGSCGMNGAITVNVASAGTCAIAVNELTDIGLPGTGTCEAAASATSYNLKQGNWGLADVPNGAMDVGTFLNCTSGAANSLGEFDLVCTSSICAVGDTDDVECTTGTTCTAHLSPATSGDAGMSDAGVPGVADATTGG